MSFSLGGVAGLWDGTTQVHSSTTNTDTTTTESTIRDDSNPILVPTSQTTTSESIASATLPKKVTYFNTLKCYFTKPKSTILKYPVQSLIYNVILKVIFYTIAQSFPLFGWTAFAVSTVLFERVIIFNPKSYCNAIIQTFKDTMRSLFGKKTKSTTIPSSSENTTPSTIENDITTSRDRETTPLENATPTSSESAHLNYSLPD